MTTESMQKKAPRIEKAATGIKGLDEITRGGLPKGRTVLVSGGPGSGKTLLGIEFLYRGAVELDEPGVFVCFEETAEELINNTGSFGWNIQELIDEERLFIEHIQVESKEILETGAYDLDALFIRLMSAVQTVRAKRIVLDTVESLFASLPNETLLRSELRRLFHWLKDQGLTAVITGERGEDSLTRHGLEEYVSDCVIEMSRRTENEMSTRRLQILKYRGTSHETNTFPYLIDKDGFFIVPITSAALEHEASEERISTGIAGLDAMLGGQGFYRGSSVLVSGQAGTGKSSVAAKFALSTCDRGERCLYVAFEEASKQIIRNMRSIGIDLQPQLQAGNLRLVAERPTQSGLEMHLANLFRQVEEFNPQTVILDPITSLLKTGTPTEVQYLLIRYMDFLKQHNITCLCTNLLIGVWTDTQSEMDTGISSIMDTWALLRNIESNGEHNRLIYLIKSRGMQHTKQVREFIISDEGIDLVDISIGPEGVRVGSTRKAQDKIEVLETQAREREIRSRQSVFEQKKAAVEARIRALEAELAGEREMHDLAESELRLMEKMRQVARSEMTATRHSTTMTGNKGEKG